MAFLVQTEKRLASMRECYGAVYFLALAVRRYTKITTRTPRFRTYLSLRGFSLHKCLTEPQIGCITPSTVAQTRVARFCLTSGP
jgi:hypothetical protein